MKGALIGLLLVLIILIIITAASGATECWICGGDSGYDCKSPAKKPCKLYFEKRRDAVESGSPPAVSAPTDAPAEGARKKRDVDYTCRKEEKGGTVVKQSCQEKPDKGCKDTDGTKICFCNSNLCNGNGSSLPKSISVWGLGFVALLVLLHSSKIL